MKIGIAADHKGYVIKQMTKAYLIATGHEVMDFGSTHLDEFDDYSDYVVPLSMALYRNEVERGIAIFNNAMGAYIIANKVKGVRAALINDHFNAHNAVEENNVNLECLPASSISYPTTKELIQLFLDARFDTGEKDHRWLRKVIALESTNRFLWPLSNEVGKRG
jgi:ribose 5-phosphate isomerase B